MKRVLFVAAFALLAIGLAVSCRPKGENDASVEDGDSLYEYDEYKSATSPEVSRWLQHVSLDSAVRIISRHNGVVDLGDTSLQVRFVDVLRCCTAEAMEYPFRNLDDVMYDFTDYRTDDGRLRIFYWNTLRGGTCPDIERYTLLCADDGSVHLLEGGHESSQLRGLYSLKTKRDKTIYLMHEYFREWSTFGAAWAWCCCIKGNTLDTLKLFPHNEAWVGVEYWIPDWYFLTNDGEGWDWLFELYEDKLYVPIVLNNGLTDRYNLYQWNGQCFDSIGYVANRRLHPSLQEYYALCWYFVTSGFRVRIDEMVDNGYRYASWPRSKPTSAKPDIVIYGGSYDAKQDCYIFENEGYTYRVGKIVSEGEKFWGLTVEKEGKVLLQQLKVHE